MKVKADGKGKITVPKSALQLYDRDNSIVQFAEDKDGKPTARILAHSGKPFKHLWWGNFAINLGGMKPAKKSLPLLRDHRTDKEMGFFTKPTISNDGISIEPETVTLLDNEEVTKFVQNSKAGFPYEASIYVIPTKIRRVDEKEEVEVNGHKLRGPGTIFEETILKEASVCVFGYDPNTKSSAMSDGDDSVTLSVEGMDENEEEEVTEIMKLSELKKKDPEGYAKLVEEAQTSAKEEFQTQLTEMSEKVKTLEQTNTKLEEDKQKLEEDKKDTEMRLTRLEERDREREIKASAEKIIAAAFSESDLSESAKTKVRKYLDHSKYVKEDGFDSEGYTKFVQDELKDWETALSSEEGSVQGTGQTGRDVDEGDTSFTDDEADEITDRMLARLGQKPEKNE